MHYVVSKMFILIQYFFSAAIFQQRSTTLLPTTATMANGGTPPSFFGDIYLGVGANGEKVRPLVVMMSTMLLGASGYLAMSPSIRGRRIVAMGFRSLMIG